MCHILPHVCSICRNENQVFSSFMTYLRIYNKINTTGTPSGEGITYPSAALAFAAGLWWGLSYSIFSFLCRVLQIIACPFVHRFVRQFDLRFLNTPLESSIFSDSDIYKYLLYIMVSSIFNVLSLKYLYLSKVTIVMNIINVCIMNDIAVDKTKIDLHQSEWLYLERKKCISKTGVSQ